jgi:hypothetical protein
MVWYASKSQLDKIHTKVWIKNEENYGTHAEEGSYQNKILANLDVGVLTEADPFLVSTRHELEL